ncbi:MAG: NADH-quinone oxidoreductase subunit L [Deltaproteobacteria bacterium 13_1_40CM_4_68_19]|nr:MAG: NADH-quinone oxidoreductase subunit L [Deltaproteobacteria bacterium 13_1_40CM_4_68_19]OLD08859.1 MAG: NADH-quinone oxidoreductase subunit L [Deltaproteobacteria bacterium 13_1_40CM_3_69_14]OLD45799.1 MAG: NADH-quinone oxidoreductase subunit L [Chloroflexi bacterium 13_1_40CM_2_68_14]
MEVTWLHLVPLLPLIGAAICGLVGKWLPKGWVYAVALASVLLSFLIGLRAFIGLGEQAPLFHELWFNWFSAGSLRVDMAFSFDRLSGALTLVVTGVGFLIHVYSVGYMEEDPGYWRYFSYLNLFIAAMMTLVLGDNLVAMFVGWEGVGLCSYLLIGFWFTDEEKAYAGRKAFIVNRIGDFGFLIGIFILFNQVGTVGIAQINSAVLPLGVASIAALCLFIGATGKSAQLPLYIWLPDAMAGPTPVSALIHAATMVTAGVYMVARLSHLYVSAPGVMAVVAVVGVLTALWSALIATSQNDIKKVLAYSTVSQLGFMFIGVGVGAFFAGTMHLVTHAFFKACLFLGSGAVIHGLHGEQDIQRMGGLRKYLPSTRTTFLVATIAITGILPISGFFSKDEILGQALHTRAFSFLTLTPDGSTRLTWLGPLIYAVGSFSAFLTSFYMWRCYFLTFSGEYRGPESVHPHESPSVMTLPLWILAALSVIGLVLGLPQAWVHGTGLQHWTWEHFTDGVFSRPRGGAPEEFSPYLGYGIALIVGWAGWACSYALYFKRGLAGDELLTARIHVLRGALANKLYVDELYDFLVVRPFWALARGLFRLVDATLIDGLFVNGIPTLIAWVGAMARRFQNGDVQRYLAVTALGVAALLYVFLVRG